MPRHCQDKLEAHKRSLEGPNRRQRGSPETPLGFLRTASGVFGTCLEGPKELFTEKNVPKLGDFVVIFLDTDFSMFLLEEANVATVTGDAFGAPNCIRMSYAASEDQLREAITRIKVVLN